MTQVFDTEYNPVATLATLDVEGLLAHTDNLLDTASAFLGCSRYDIAVINQIIATHGRTRRGAALARAYFEMKED